MFLDTLFGSTEKQSKKYLEKVNNEEANVLAVSDGELKDRSMALRAKIADGLSLDEALPEAFALVREAAKRTLNQRHFDTQILAGYHIHRGSIVELATGEGKTLSATAPAYLNALSGNGVHVITVNDYLAMRDIVWMGQIYHLLGLTASCLVHSAAYIYDPDFRMTDDEEKAIDEKRDDTGSFRVQHKYLRPISRKQAYLADITYGTNHEFGFDYLRDNLARNDNDQVQRAPNFAIIDEVDSILIDEARTPLIISSPDASSSEYYRIMTRAVANLVKDEDYVIDEKMKSAAISESGIDKVEKITGINNIYSPESIRLVHYLEECLKAKTLFTRDKDYVIKDGEVIIVDQFTGRLMHGRRYSGGLHQAIEAKESVKVQEESKTYAQITIQNYFRLYKKISGMTGTARTSAEEFHKVYGLDVTAIPTNKPIIREDRTDLIYKTADAKWKAVAEEAGKRSNAGQPVLIGTVSIEKNELLAKYLDRAGVAYEILNAKNHEREGAIIAQAGRKGAVTLATNMAGRGVDIILGGSPFDEKKAEEVKEAGGLCVIGTERHDARRIDNQLRGRSGRQGDPGSSLFFISLDDDLMRIFGGERLKGMMQTLNIPDDQPIESGFVSKVLVEAQKKVEGLNFDSRKHLLDYDDVLNKQRLALYHRRQEILAADREKILSILDLAMDAYHNSLPPEEQEKMNTEDLKDRLRTIDNVEGLRMPVLTVLDMLWMNHLEDLEALTESVRIRAYGQHDPLVEYRRESHMLFRDMNANFESWLHENALKIKPADEGDIQTSGNSYQQVDQRAQSAAADLNMTPEELADIGRNDPCPCGAKNEDGTPKKFKKCHGR